MGEYDRSSKWHLQHHGDSILRLAGAEAIASWRALQAEVVQPGQLPDGVIEVRHADLDEPIWYVVEMPLTRSGGFRISSCETPCSCSWIAGCCPR